MKENIVKVEKIEELAIKLPDGFAEVGEKVHISVRDDGSMVVSKLVPIELDLPKDMLLDLAMLAHEQDITLNELFVNIMREIIDTDGKCLIGSECENYPECPCETCGTQRCYPDYCDAFMKYETNCKERN